MHLSSHWRQQSDQLHSNWTGHILDRLSVAVHAPVLWLYSPLRRMLQVRPTCAAQSRPVTIDVWWLLFSYMSLCGDHSVGQWCQLVSINNAEWQPISEQWRRPKCSLCWLNRRSRKTINCKALYHATTTIATLRYLFYAILLCFSNRILPEWHCNCHTPLPPISTLSIHFCLSLVTKLTERPNIFLQTCDCY